MFFGSLVDGEHFKSILFRKQACCDNHVIFLTEFSSNTNPKWPVAGCAFKFLWHSVDGKYLLSFQSESLFSNYFSLVWTGSLITEAFW